MGSMRSVFEPLSLSWGNWNTDGWYVPSWRARPVSYLLVFPTRVPGAPQVLEEPFHWEDVACVATQIWAEWSPHDSCPFGGVLSGAPKVPPPLAHIHLWTLRYPRHKFIDISKDRTLGEGSVQLGPVPTCGLPGRWWAIRRWLNWLAPFR